MTTHWDFPPEINRLGLGEVHIWRIWLDVAQDEVESLQVSVSKNEMERSKKFHFRKDRERYIVAHSSLRHILSRYLDLPPDQIHFTYNEQGKPELDPAYDYNAMRFNLSHSDSVGLVAISRGSRLGVDVERIRLQAHIEEIAHRFFSPGEVRQLMSQPESQREEAFFRCWTRKEAYLKALGVGMLLPLDHFEVALEPGVPPKIIHIGGDEGEAERWNLYHIDPMEGYIGALVVEGNPVKLKFLQSQVWPDS